MSAMLRIAARVIQRRLDQGEPWDLVVQDYPRLSQEELEEIREALGISTKEE